MIEKIAHKLTRKPKLVAAIWKGSSRSCSPWEDGRSWGR